MAEQERRPRWSSNRIILLAVCGLLLAAIATVLTIRLVPEKQTGKTTEVNDSLFTDTSATTSANNPNGGLSESPTGAASSTTTSRPSEPLPTTPPTQVTISLPPSSAAPTMQNPAPTATVSPIHTTSTPTDVAASSEETSSSTTSTTTTTTTTTTDAPWPTIEPIVQSDTMKNGCFELDCLENVYAKNTRDRLGHNAPIYKGQALCNGDEDRYPGVLFQFGLTHNGALVWQNCSSVNPTQDSEILVLHDAAINDDSIVDAPSNQVWFQMTPEATWQIRYRQQDDDTSAALVWEHAVEHPHSTPATPIEPRTCLTGQPVLDCPYIHFRRHGDVVMNFRSPTSNAFIACKSRRTCYSELFQ